MDISKIVISVIILMDKGFKYGDDAKIWVFWKETLKNFVCTFA
jgi:hypothetical protein